MKTSNLNVPPWASIAWAFAALLFTGCGGSSSAPVQTYVLTITSNSISRSTGIVGSDPEVTIQVAPADNGRQNSGKVQFDLTYNSDSTVTLTAPKQFGQFTFQNWANCNQGSSTVTCKVSMSSDQTVNAGYTTP